MGKLAERRIELAQLLLAETDKTTLDLVEHALLGAAPLKLSRAEIDELDRQADRIERGEEKTYTWSEVQKKLKRKSRR